MTLGRFFYCCGVLIFAVVTVTTLLVGGDKTGAIYNLCEAIGLMLIGSRVIDDAKKK